MNTKISSIAMFVLIVISAILFIVSMSGSVDPILYGSYIYFGLGLIVTLGGAVVGFMTNPGGIKEMVIGLVAMVVLFGISYGMADGSDYVKYEYANLSEAMSRFSGMLLYAIYILFGVSILTVAASWIYSLTR